MEKILKEISKINVLILISSLVAIVLMIYCILAVNSLKNSITQIDSKIKTIEEKSAVLSLLDTKIKKEEKQEMEMRKFYSR